MDSSQLWAHGVGGGSDLPIPATGAVLGGTAALVVSFAVLVMAWRRPRYQGATPGETGRRASTGEPAGRRVDWLARVVDHPVFRGALRAFGLAAAGFTVWCALAGPDNPGTNPVALIVYVLLWVGLVPASLLLGPVIRAISPLRSLHWVISRLLGRERSLGFVRLPAWVGCWPAALGLLAFAWMELISTDGTSLSVLVPWFSAYAVVVLGGAIVFGEDWFEAADPFEVYSTLISSLSIWSVRDAPTGLQLRVVSPLRHLPDLPVRPGLVAVVGVLLGSTAFDSLTGSTDWLRWRQSTDANVPLVETMVLLAVVGAVTLAFVAATWPSFRGGRVSPRAVPGLMAHSLVPIILGYVVAHYLSLFVESGQLALIRISDPLGTGANLFGTADRQVNLWLSLHPSLLATLKVLAIVLGHILGAVSSHDRALALLPRERQSAGQLPLLLVMVGYTFGGLYLLFGM